MIKVDKKYDQLIAKLYHSTRNTCMITAEFLSEISLSHDELNDFLSTPSQNKWIVIGKNLTNGGYIQAMLTDKWIAYFDNGFSLDKNENPQIMVHQTINGWNGIFSALNQWIQNNTIAQNQTIDQIIELLKQSDKPKKQEIIEVAERYKLSPSMELFWKLVGMCADTGTTAQILNMLCRALLSSSQ